MPIAPGVGSSAPVVQGGGRAVGPRRAGRWGPGCAWWWGVSWARGRAGLCRNCHWGRSRARQASLGLQELRELRGLPAGRAQRGWHLQTPGRARGAWGRGVARGRGLGEAHLLLAVRHLPTPWRYKPRWRPEPHSAPATASPRCCCCFRARPLARPPWPALRTSRGSGA